MPGSANWPVNCLISGDKTDWCERGDSNPHGFTRQILSSPRTKNQQFSAVWMLSHSPVKMRVSALRPTSQLNPSKRPLGTKLGTVCSAVTTLGNPHGIRRFPPGAPRGTNPSNALRVSKIGKTCSRADPRTSRLWPWEGCPRVRGAREHRRHSRLLELEKKIRKIGEKHRSCRLFVSGMRKKLSPVVWQPDRGQLVLRFEGCKPFPCAGVRQCPPVLDFRDCLPTNTDQSS